MIIFTRVINKIKYIYCRRSSESYINYLRTKGITIGKGTYVQSPLNTEIDETRPSLVTIGENCFINKYFEIHTHDWVTHIFLHSGRQFVNSSGRVKIGNNVAFGRHVMILKGVTIGDNCFVGANSVVSKDIPANSIAVGSPAKVVMSLEDYYQKRLNSCEEEAFDYARSIEERFGRKPIPGDFWEEFHLFVSGNEVNRYPEIPIKRQLGPIYDRYLKGHKAKYDSFEAFLRAAGIK